MGGEFGISRIKFPDKYSIPTSLFNFLIEKITVCIQFKNKLKNYMRQFIPDTNDLYEITDDGRVISYNKYKEGHELKGAPVGDGYKAVVIKYNDGKYKMRYVHRLVAEAFIPNPNNLPIINHKDENKLNNCVDNLEWCTAKYNCNYSKDKKKSISRKNSGAPKRVALLDENYEIERVFFSIRDAARFICPDNENSAYVMINRVCHKHVGHVSACNRKWTFIDNDTFINWINKNPDWLDENRLRQSKLIVRTMLEKTMVRYNPKTGNYTPFKEIVEIKKEDGSRTVRLF